MEGTAASVGRWTQGWIQFETGEYILDPTIRDQVTTAPAACPLPACRSTAQVSPAELHLGLAFRSTRRALQVLDLMAAQGKNKACGFIGSAPTPTLPRAPQREGERSAHKELR